LIQFASRTDLQEDIRAEALAALGTWANPSVLDRVDGRYRGATTRDLAKVQSKVKPLVNTILKENNPVTQAATAGLLANLQMSDANQQLADLFATTKSAAVKSAIINALSTLKYDQITGIIKTGMEDPDETVRTTALGLLDNTNVSKESLPAIVQTIFTKGGIREQQQLLVVMGKLDPDKTTSALSNLIEQLKNNKLASQLRLELTEAVEASGSAELKAQLAAVKPGNSLMDEYAESLFGGDSDRGWGLFFYNSSAQCVRCHTMGGDGGKVGPDLTHIGATLKREQLLEALILPSERIAPGYGNVSLTLKDGQQVFGVLTKETATELTIATSHAEPLIVPVSRISKRENLPSGMPTMEGSLSKREIRDLVEFLAKQQ
jgi:quinoprotein glucose dehydrogenase